MKHCLLRDMSKLAAEEGSREVTYTWLFIGTALLPGPDWQQQGLAWCLGSAVQNHWPATLGHETKPPSPQSAPGPHRVTWLAGLHCY